MEQQSVVIHLHPRPQPVSCAAVLFRHTHVKCVACSVQTVLAGGDSVKVYFFTSLQIKKEDFRYIAPVKSYKVTPVLSACVCCRSVLVL